MLGSRLFRDSFSLRGERSRTRQQKAGIGCPRGYSVSPRYQWYRRRSPVRGVINVGNTLEVRGWRYGGNRTGKDGFAWTGRVHPFARGSRPRISLERVEQSPRGATERREPEFNTEWPRLSEFWEGATTVSKAALSLLRVHPVSEPLHDPMHSFALRFGARFLARHAGDQQYECCRRHRRLAAEADSHCQRCQRPHPPRGVRDQEGHRPRCRTASPITRTCG